MLSLRDTTVVIRWTSNSYMTLHALKKIKWESLDEREESSKTDITSRNTK